MNALLNQFLFGNAGDDTPADCLKAHGHLDPLGAFDACAERGREALKARMALEILGIAGLAAGALLVIGLATGLRLPAVF